MNTNYKSIIAQKWHRQILSAVCLSAFLLITATFAQTPPLRANGKIAFTSDRDGNQEIYVMNNDSTGQVRLTNNPGVDDYLTWSPDGRRIVFVSPKSSGAFTINLMNTDQGIAPFQFGLSSDKLVPADYDGDGKQTKPFIEMEHGICGKAQTEFRFSHLACLTTDRFLRLICLKIQKIGR